jgi:hypothetical protein
MTKKFEFTYRLFDRKLIAEISLPLLSPWGDTDISEKPSIWLELSDELFEPIGSVVFENPKTPLKILFDGTNSIFILSPLPVAAIVNAVGEKITVHPLLNSTPERGQQEFDLASKLVTWVLSHVPILWGTPAIHGATLSLGEKTILLLGESGVGKSTISQHLVRDFGFTLHDDDTACVDLFGQDSILVPMGAAPRLRKDAAQVLNLTGRALKGYAGEKIALVRQASSPKEMPPKLAAIFLLAPDSPQNVSTDILSYKASQISPIRALVEITSHIFLTSTVLQQREVQFHSASMLARSPTYSLRFKHETHTPHQIAAEIWMAIEP